mgnify:CR=1 FL=1
MVSKEKTSRQIVILGGKVEVATFGFVIVVEDVVVVRLLITMLIILCSNFNTHAT